MLIRIEKAQPGSNWRNCPECLEYFEAVQVIEEYAPCEILDLPAAFMHDCIDACFVLRRHGYARMEWVQRDRVYYLEIGVI